MNSTTSTAAALPVGPVAALTTEPLTPCVVIGPGFAVVMAEAMAITPTLETLPATPAPTEALPKFTSTTLTQSAAINPPMSPTRLVASEPDSSSELPEGWDSPKRAEGAGLQRLPLATSARPAATGRTSAGEASHSNEESSLPSSASDTAPEASDAQPLAPSAGSNARPAQLVDELAGPELLIANGLTPTVAPFTRLASDARPSPDEPFAPARLGVNQVDRSLATERTASAEELSRPAGGIEEAPSPTLTRVGNPETSNGTAEKSLPGLLPSQAAVANQLVPVKLAQGLDVANAPAQELAHFFKATPEVESPLTGESTAEPIGFPATATSVRPNTIAESRVDLASGPRAEFQLLQKTPQVREALTDVSGAVAARAKRAPLPASDGLGSDSDVETAPQLIASAVERPLPGWRVQSAAEAKFAPMDQREVSASPSTMPYFRAGTGTAEQADGMKNSSEQKQFAGLALPSLAEQVLRSGVRLAVETVTHAQARPEAESQLISLLSTSQPSFRASEGLGSPPLITVTSAATPAEILQSSVLKHVTELRHTGATEMAVVLRPDADTQIALRLTMSSTGEVTVHARCEQGDTQALAENWGEIRHSLAQQGVRLGALEFSSERTANTLNQQAGNGGPSPDGQPSSQRHGQPWPETLDDLPLVGSLTEPPARRGVQRAPAGRERCWESWA